MFRSDSSDGGPAADAAPTPGPVTVSVCVSCRGKNGEPSCAGEDLITALRAELGSDAGDITVRPVQCLGVCRRPTTAAVSAADGYTFLFGDLEPADAAAALARFVRSYRDAAYGFVPWRERGEVLRRGLVARLPPASWSPPDGHPPA
jgi:predicted metal-binding protein